MHALSKLKELHSSSQGQRMLHKGGALFNLTMLGKFTENGKQAEKCGEIWCLVW